MGKGERRKMKRISRGVSSKKILKRKKWENKKERKKNER
jgi:hypothetical protein